MGGGRLKDYGKKNFYFQAFIGCLKLITNAKYMCRVAATKMKSEKKTRVVPEVKANERCVSSQNNNLHSLDLKL